MRTTARIRHFEEWLLEAIDKSNLINKLEEKYPRYWNGLLFDLVSLEDKKLSAEDFIKGLRNNPDISRNLVYDSIKEFIPEHFGKRFKDLIYGENRPRIYWIEYDKKRLL
ncbi:MAG: hypothetical protein PHG05_02705 [Candidatus Nanoarchaeia archaeon]|nr:hypothetical protein [Candidatus Nanoarchaeia archaeon]